MDQDRITVKAEERHRLTCKTWKRFKDRLRKGWTPPDGRQPLQA